MQQPTSAWSLPFIWLTVLSGCGLWIGVVYIGRDIAQVLPIALVGMIVGGMFIWQVVCGKRWAVITLTVVGVLWAASSFRQRQAGDVSLDWQNGLKFTIWCCFLAVGVLNLHRIIKYLGDPVMFCVVLYLFLAFMSFIYSEAPLVTLVAVVVIMSYVLFACSLVDALSIRDVMLLTTWTLGAFCLISLLAVPLVPNLAFPQTVGFGESQSDLMRVQGLAGHPNQLGAIAKMFMIFLIGSTWLGYLRPVQWIPMSLLGLFTIGVTQSRTAFFALVIASFLQMPRRVILPIIVLFGSLVILIVASGEVTTVMSMIGRGGSVSEAESMSGRTELWQFTWRLIQERPFLGYGFNSFEAYAPTAWTGETRSDVVGPHNNYLAMLYNGGIFGMLPWAAAFIILLYRWYRDPYLPRDLFTISTLFTGYAEADLPTNSIVPTLSFFVILALDIKRRATVPS